MADGPDAASAERVQALRERRAGAFEGVVREFTAPLYSMALSLGFPEGDAEDLVQETFSAFLSALDRFEGRSQLKTFLIGILINKARALRAKRGRELAVDPQEPATQARFDESGMWAAPPRGPEGEALNDELREIIARCADDLTADQREALFLKEVEREDSRTICNTLGVSYTNLRVILHRARNRMRDCLEIYWGRREGSSSGR